MADRIPPQPPTPADALFPLSVEEKARFFDLLTNHMEEIVILRDGRGELLYVNPAVEKISGLPLRETAWQVDDVLAKFLHPEDAARCAEQARRFVEDHDDLYLEFRSVSPEGRTVWWANRAYWVGEDACIGLMYDITRRREAEDTARAAAAELEERVAERTRELEAAKRALEEDIRRRQRAEEERDRMEAELRRGQTLEAVGRLAGGVAHDFNNLLGGVLASLYAARLGAAGNPQVRAELEGAEELCRRGGELTRQLLTVARRPAGRVEPLCARTLLDETRALVERTLPKTVTVAYQADSDLPRVRGDRGLLTAALLNLCLNAADAMPGGGVLTLRARRQTRSGEAPEAVIEVSDTGPGVPAELRGRVFEPFFTTKPPEQGSGMGLAMVKATVDEAGGRVWVADAPQGGALFGLALPAAAAQTEPVWGAEPLPATEHPVLDGAVLVVEDEDVVARMVVDVLTRHGYPTLRAADGLEALERVRDHRGELALVALDLMLPELDGQGVYRLLQTLAPELPVLFITGRQDLARDAAPGVPVLPKPFGDAELLEALAREFGPGAGNRQAG